MKKYIKSWLVLLINVILWYAYYTLSVHYIEHVMRPDIYLHGDGSYHFGYASLAIVVSVIFFLILLIIELIYRKRHKEDKSIRIQTIIVSVLLAVFLFWEITFYLSWYSFFYFWDLFK